MNTPNRGWIRPRWHRLRFLRVAMGIWALLASSSLAQDAQPGLERLDLPDEWEARFWSGADAKALLALEPKALSELVPVQAGFKFCRCPACGASDLADPLSWSAQSPKELVCKQCKVKLPNDKYPAKDDKKAIPEETIEVSPGVTHKYPYHEIEAAKAVFPGERSYLSAKIDDAAREVLARAALYAAVRYHEQPRGGQDPKLARLAAVILVRFAQVYPLYATHFDRPGQAKILQQADLAPPYRSGYGTGKWQWAGSRNVPLNLLVAYTLLRGDPAIAAAGEILGEKDPARAIENDLFRASAEFARRQPEEFSEESLQVYRGMLAAGRLLNDQPLIDDAMTRLDRFTQRGFYHDGLWRGGTLDSHRRVLGRLDGWIDRLIEGEAGQGTRGEAIPMIELARAAESALLKDPAVADVRLASWPGTPHAPAPPRGPTLLGGSGRARLAVGGGGDALDLELTGLASHGGFEQVRQSLQVAVGGRLALAGLPESPGTTSGFERASVSKNTVVIDGLNQRESMAKAREPAPGGNFLFFAADPDFQVVALDDPWAYPASATRYRQILVAVAGSRTRYALAVFDVEGGLQHDQLFHAPSGSTAGWRLDVPMSRAIGTLLPPGLTYVPSFRPADARWFVQSYAEFQPLGRGEIRSPSRAMLEGDPAVRLHILGDAPLAAMTVQSPDPAREAGKASLILRRRSSDGSTLRTRFVTLIEPVSQETLPLTRVGRVASVDGVVVVFVESPEGVDHLVVNLEPGQSRSVKLADGRTLKTDGIATRVNPQGLTLAGGTLADAGAWRARHAVEGGQIRASVRRRTDHNRGWFESDTPLPAPESVAGRSLLIRHGDGTVHGWTVEHAENTERGAKLFVIEEPGFEIDPMDLSARYYQFPGTTIIGPHAFRIGQISRSKQAPANTRNQP